MGLDRQEFFNGTYRHFVQPGAKLAIRESDSEGSGLNALPSCYYRLNFDATSKVRCAIGVHIRDDEYIPEMDGSNGDGYTVAQVAQHCGWEVGDGSQFEEGSDLYFLAELQGKHDGASSIEDLLNELRGFADKYELTVPEV